MPLRPGKPIDEMTADEIRQWEAWLLAEGMNPLPIRQDIPPGTSSYAFDPALNATIEYVGERRYFVGIVDGKVARLAPVESAQESSNTCPPALAAQPQSPENAHIGPPEIRERKLA